MLNDIDLSRLDLNLLVLFEAVMEERHVGRTAERLSLTPSAVSHGLGRLRRMLNDPLFLKHPKGVSPTPQAEALAAPIAEVLERVRGVVAAATPFDPATSRRRFRIGGPDAILATILPLLTPRVRAEAPGVDLALQVLMPLDVAAALDAGRLDVGLTPLGRLPARFVRRPLFEDGWVIAMRRGHRLAAGLDLDGYCAADHVVMSVSGDPQANVDADLEALGRRRRVAVTAPNMLLGLALASESDLLMAAPAGLVRSYAARFRLTFREPPTPLERFEVSAVAPQAALADPGVAWLFGILAAASREAKPSAGD
jgi:DNA-binding transcriptional LysR family regulator